MSDYFRETHKELYFAKRTNLDFPPHIHNDFELVLLKSGSVEIVCNGELISLNTGEIFLCFPNQVHFYKNCSTCCDSVILVVAPSKLPLDNAAIQTNSPPYIHYKQDSYNDNTENLINIALCELNAENNQSYIFYLIASIILKIISKQSFKKTSQISEGISKILQYCNSHFRENITLKDISKELNISESHLSHTFSNKLKISFSGYMNSLKLNHAVKLLKSTDLSITEIALSSGYNTIRSFNREFLKYYNTTPRDYRMRQ